MGSANLTYLITGAASGIGAATAELLAERGDRVAIADINFGAAEELASRLGADTIALELDITSAAQQSDATPEWMRERTRLPGNVLASRPAGAPYLFARPLPRPFRVDERVVAGGARERP
jgi:NAD(P)-dependent dehydrogenase (short-subunit alcohol dehydrogenase family)